MNFHYEVLARMGFEDECVRIQELYLARDRTAAMKAIPTAMVEDVALVGPEAKLRENLEAWRATCITTLVVGGSPATLETMRRLVDG